LNSYQNLRRWFVDYAFVDSGKILSLLRRASSKIRNRCSLQERARKAAIIAQR
jgi:hypothetical protein